jgi:NADH:ubiquinone oxidoreductase subunit F (NADH-binding)/NADH:ubiquinone oxidoreductase subunit E
MLIDELRAIQEEHGYLPDDALRALAERLDVPVYQLHGVATFFPHFRLVAPPPVEVLVCRDMSCHLRGGDRLTAALEGYVKGTRVAGVAVHETSCLGMCDRAPAAAVNDVSLGPLTPEGLEHVVEEATHGRRPSRPRPGPPPARLGIDPYETPEQRYGVLAALVASQDVASLLATLKASGLRGLGGAMFPTGTKWEIVRAAAGDAKYVVCNADESEPGTIKDRFILEHVPHLLLEGMALAGVTIGAKEGIVYIRHEYAAQVEAVQREIDACHARGVLGPDVLGSGIAFDIRIFVSPGGYICGEESALLEALEGKRAEPRNKPPFPGTHGLWQKPTVINNVETFAFTPLILRQGVEAFKALGRNGAPGLKFVGVSGHVTRPGVFEVPMGTPARDVVFELAGGILGGRQLKAWAPSGPSSGYLPASKIDTPLDHPSLQKEGSMLGSGAIVVCAEGTCMLDMALNSVRFFRNESCGKCVPCRVGTAKLTDILTGIARGRGREEDLAVIDELGLAMAQTSICGLGQIAPAPVQSVIKHFRDEIDAHVRERRCPEGVCPMR